MANLGYDIGEVDITVGTNYEAVGESLSAGTSDIGLIPGGTYVLYDDGAEVVLTATRAGLSVDSDDPKEWNDNKPTEASDEQATGYRALIIAGPSEKGQELAQKVNNGEELTFEDVNSAFGQSCHHLLQLDTSILHYGLEINMIKQSRI